MSCFSKMDWVQIHDGMKIIYDRMVRSSTHTFVYEDVIRAIAYPDEAEVLLRAQKLVSGSSASPDYRIEDEFYPCLEPGTAFEFREGACKCCLFPKTATIQGNREGHAVAHSLKTLLSINEQFAHANYALREVHARCNTLAQAKFYLPCLPIIASRSGATPFLEKLSRAGLTRSHVSLPTEARNAAKIATVLLTSSELIDDAAPTADGLSITLRTIPKFRLYGETVTRLY